MIVGVISDTHGVLPVSIHEVFADVDRIIHAGDVGPQSVVMELESIAPTCVVRGNCDGFNLPGTIERVAEPVIGNVKFRVAHKEYDLDYPNGDAQVFICGHTHTPDVRMDEGKFLINPGSASEPRGGSVQSVAKIDIENEMVFNVGFYPL